jgi:hypothetical protein
MPPYPGLYHVNLGLYANVQRLDPASGVWRYSGDGGIISAPIYFDGSTTRIANTTGCAVAALVVGGGTGYTAAPTVTPSAGGSVWVPIIGGAVSTAAVIAVAGSGYQYPPLLFIGNPSPTGIPATGYTTISNGSISAVTIDGQGAGYQNPPSAILVNDWRDTVGSGGAVTLALTGAGTVTGIVCTNHGTPITSGTVPTLAFGTGAATATVIMDWTVNSVSISAAGAGYTGSSLSVTATGTGGFLTTTPTLLGASTTTDMVRWRDAQVEVATNSAGGLASYTIIDGGRYHLAPTAAIISAAVPTTAGALTFAMGGNPATVFISPASAVS